MVTGVCGGWLVSSVTDSLVGRRGECLASCHSGGLCCVGGCVVLGCGVCTLGVLVEEASGLVVLGHDI